MESPGFYPNLDARRNLALFTAGEGPRGGVEALLDFVGLGAVGTKPSRRIPSG